MPGKFTFYSNQITDETAFFDENEHRHAIVTLRNKVGDKIEFTDGLGNCFLGEIERIEKSQFQARITDKKNMHTQSNLQICIGIIKSTERLEWLVEKCTEIGVGGIHFMETKNSERGRINLERAQKIAISALKQSHGSFLPVIDAITWRAALQIEAENKCIANAEQSFSAGWGEKCQRNISTNLLIGPEGDFTLMEMQDAIALDYETVSLGNSILRTETAAVVACAVFALAAK